MKHTKQIIDNGDGTLSVELTRGFWTTIDESCKQILFDFSWRANVRSDGTVIAAASIYDEGKRATINMHSAILHCDVDGVSPDHIDRNPLNNRLSNLRRSNQKQQNMNRATCNPNGYIGVHFDKRRKSRPFCARAVDGGKLISESYHETAEEAARSRDRIMHDHYIKTVDIIPDGCDNPDYDFIVWNFPR